MPATAPPCTQSPSTSGGLFPQTAKLSLDFLIVGASIGGLACAYNLSQAGHRVRVVEQDDGVGKSSGGVRSGPNMTRLLLRWGLEERMKKISTNCSQIAFRIGATGEHVSSIVFHEELMKVVGADLLMVHHADLHVMLYELALESGACIDFNSTVVDVDPSDPSVTLSTGRKIYADIVIGADGGQSIVRPLMIGWQEEEEIGFFTGYSFTIPTASLKDDEELAPFIQDYSWNIWMNDGCSIITHLARGGSELAVNLFWTACHSEYVADSQKDWATCVPLSALDFSLFEPRIQRLVGLAKSAVGVRHVIQEPLEDWYDENGKVVLVGEAAHLINPGGSQAAAMAVEDAAVLGSLFSRLRTREQITHLLSAFQELRQDRCRAAQESELGKAKLLLLPNGPQQEARDAAMRAATDGWDDVSEDYLRGQWEEFRDIFGYDAYDAADTWWVEWGILLERSAALDQHQAQSIAVHVTKDDSDEFVMNSRNGLGRQI